jgi:dTDP-4-amino-4,6-dideoxygalactose transaminase
MIPFAKPCLGAEEAEAASRAVESGWVTQGRRVAEFERMFADHCDVSEAVAVSNCSAGLHLSLLALDIGGDDEVICPSLSFIATANAVCHAGATPVFAEVDPETYNLEPGAAERAISPRTKAILIVHQMGLPAEIDTFREIGRRHGIHILEDAACAIGSTYRGSPIGGHTEMACFSFHPRKVITTGEGGMVTTNNSAYAARLRLLRHQGMNIPDSVRHSAKSVITERYPYIGFNYRLTDIQAAIGIEQMKKLESFVQRRRELAARYDQALADHPWLHAPFAPKHVRHNYQSYAVRLADDAPLARDELMQRLLDVGIATRRGVMLAHLEDAHRARCEPGQLPASEQASERSLLLPMFPQMTSAQQDRVIAALFACGTSAQRPRSPTPQRTEDDDS